MVLQHENENEVKQTTNIHAEQEQENTMGFQVHINACSLEYKMLPSPLFLFCPQNNYG